MALIQGINVLKLKIAVLLKHVLAWVTNHGDNKHSKINTAL
jgi:hypothetical protein